MATVFKFLLIFCTEFWQLSLGLVTDDDRSHDTSHDTSYPEGATAAEAGTASISISTSPDPEGQRQGVGTVPATSTSMSSSISTSVINDPEPEEADFFAALREEEVAKEEEEQKRIRDASRVPLMLHDGASGSVFGEETRGSEETETPADVTYSL